MPHGSALHDEIFCQIIRQTNGNPDPVSTRRGWALLAHAAGTIPPTPEFLPFLMYWCEQHLVSTNRTTTNRNGKDEPSEQDYVVAALAKSVQMRAKRIVDQGPRAHCPTAQEIEALTYTLDTPRPKGQPIGQPITQMQMQVHLILWQGDSSGGGNSTVVAVPVDSWTTVKDMHQMVTLEANVKDGGLFALYAGMVGDNYEGEVLDGDCRVLDVVAHWQDSDGGGSGRLFIYKVHLYLYPDRKDNAAVDLFFRQGMYDIANTRYPVPDDTYCAAMLAALQAQAQFGDYAEDGDFGEEVSAEALEVWKTFAGNTPRHAKARYLDIIQAWKFYGSKFFTVELQKDKTTCDEFTDYGGDDEVVLAINARCVFVMSGRAGAPFQSQEDTNVLAEFRYESILATGLGGTDRKMSSFVINTGNLHDPRKVCFLTECGKDIQNLILAYRRDHN